MIIPAGFAQVNLIFGGTSLPNGAQITFGVEMTDPVAFSPSSVANDVRTAWDACGIEAQLVNTQSMTGILVKFGPNSTGPSGLFPGAGAGTAATVGVTPNTSILVAKQTESGGRAGRGRFYLPGIPEANVDAAGVIAGATLTAIQGAMTDFLGKLDVADVPMKLLHAEGTSVITEPLDVTSLVVSNRVATQRRRLRR